MDMQTAARKRLELIDSGKAGSDPLKGKVRGANRPVENARGRLSPIVPRTTTARNKGKNLPPRRPNKQIQRSAR